MSFLKRIVCALKSPPPKKKIQLKYKMFLIECGQNSKWNSMMIMCCFTLNCSVFIKFSHSFSSSRAFTLSLCKISKGVSKFVLIF